MAKKNLFTQVEMTQIKSNSFDLSHDVKLSLKFGTLYPIMCTECVPGDRFNISCESLLRFAPLVAPVMHRMDVYMHYFFVPNRLLWAKWEKYITGDISAPAFPYFDITAASLTNYAIFNYMGINNSGGGATLRISALPIAAYQKIYDDYYRDQNLIAPITGSTGYLLADGDNNSLLSQLAPLRIRSWEHDYFTSCLPEAQKGDPVNLPLGGFSDVKVKSSNEGGITDTNVTWNATGVPSAGAQNQAQEYGDPDGTMGANTLYAETSELTSTSTTVSDVRRAFKLQEFLEKAMRGGTRYIEFIRSMFGVQSSDKRLQRAEYITGVKSPVVISEVLNTTGTEDAPQGNMAGHGVSVTSGNYGNYFCEEHGYIIGIMSVIPKTAYQNGVPKHFLKTNDRFDFYFEQFQHIGEQEVLNKELYAFSATGDETFGYIPRYSEYKFENNRVAGDFATTLDFWHLARQFGGQPALNQAFVECVPDTRIFAVEDGTDYLWAHVYNKVRAQRKMAFFGSPKF